MVWNDPKLFQEGEILTARDLNLYLRDNLLESEVTKCTTAGSHLTTNPAGQIIERKFAKDTVEASESLTGNPGAISDCGTFGPSVTIETGTSALVLLSAKSTTDWNGFGFDAIGVAVEHTHPITNFYSISTADYKQKINYYTVENTYSQHAYFFILTDLTPGINTFTMKYVSGGDMGSDGPATGTYSNRRLVVLPL